MPENPPRLTAEELESLREATLQRYVAADHTYAEIGRLRAYTDEPDGGLINLIDMASSLARSHEAALERIAELEVELDRLRERRRTWLLRFRTASARVAELEAQQQPRVIETPEELSALPGGALVHDGTAVFDHLGAGWWVTTGSADPIHSEAILEAEPDGTCGCTVIVLWTPEADIQSDIRILLLGKEFEARAAIDRVRKLHQPENGCDNPVHTVPDATCPQCCDYCQCCGEAMPCATIR
ncbi:hypothetical protein, partial [Nocardia farcinica]|uniref:hypothetical protein n=1 Tax=Nocardia farcinica TaxID=37329 RepID=UPI0018961E6D